ncbi:MAG: putative ATPase [Gammaproteobacteria bacterium]|jgi:predicted AAA+ superfamily ATPase|nr:putative ATPase [Gammaproteobacteria bacterium]
MPNENDIPYHRHQSNKLKKLAQVFPIICLIGPRQAGKTTLAKLTFPDYTYISLEDLDNRHYAETDPRAFLAQYDEKIIIDEVQNAPSLFSYIQTKIDARDNPGQYILTGSAHLTLLEKLTQSLAGRAALMKLLPLSISELTAAHQLKSTYIEQLLTGFYPRLYKSQIYPSDWYPNYIQTYLEKDVRNITNIQNLIQFKRFIGLCAGRHGQLLDISQLANDCGIARQTVNEWLSILEASFIIYLLPPFYKNFSKRLIKSPKLYFYDSGLVCSLLKIEQAEQLNNHYLRGAIFEGFVITEFIKYRYNQGLEPHLYFWREKNKHEIDCIIDTANRLIAVEVKSGETINDEFFKGLLYWQALTDAKPEDSFLVYAGNQKQKRSCGQVISWDALDDVWQTI